MSERFSSRHGYFEPEAEIAIRHDAPDELRSVVVAIAYDSGLTPTLLRSLLCRVLRVAPNPSNWSEFPNVDQEVRDHMRDCEWYFVYDIIEEIYITFAAGGMVTSDQRGSINAAEYFSDEINRYFKVRGIGWQLIDGKIEMRGPEAFEDAIQGAHELLVEVEHRTSANELHEAILDLSRRPNPDVTGAIQHAMAAMECLSREIAGDNCTLGQLIKQHPGLVPKPLDQAIEKAWGYSSEAGRHLKEGNSPSFEEAELIVGLVGSISRYMARKINESS